MSRKLSQRDIDRLIDGGDAAREEGAQPAVASYSFAGPKSIRKAHRARIDAACGRFAEALQETLSLQLRVPVQVAAAGIEHTGLGDYLRSVPSPCAAFVFRVEGSAPGLGVFEISTEVAHILIDRLLGGPGAPLDAGRALTALEERIVRGVVDRALPALRDAWHGWLRIDPEIAAADSNPATLRVGDAGDEVLVSILRIEVGGFPGFVSYCLPLGAMRSAGSTDPQGRAAASDRAVSGGSSSREGIEARLMEARLLVAARLPVFRLCARDAASLKPGDVVHTGHAADTPVEIHVNGRPRFLGSVGQIRQRLGLRISGASPRSRQDRPQRTRQGRVL